MWQPNQSTHSSDASLLRSILYASSFVIVLAIGIAVPTAVFAALLSESLRPLPFPEPDRLLVLRMANGRSRLQWTPLSPADFLDFRDQNHSFDSLAAFSLSTGTFTDHGDPEQISTCAVSPGFFATLGVSPVVGRSFVAEDDDAGGQTVVLISHDLWERGFGEDPSAIGKAITLNGTPRTVVGVMPKTMTAVPELVVSRIDCWIPLTIAKSEASRASRYLRCIGRLKAGVTLEQASADMATVSIRLSQQYPETNSTGVSLVALKDAAPATSPEVPVLLAGAVLVFLAACAIAISLQVARAYAPVGEAGGSQTRGFGKLLAEGTVLSAAAGVLALVIAIAGMLVINKWLPDVMAPLGPASFNMPDVIVDFALLVIAWVICTGLGSVPALWLSRIRVLEPGPIQHQFAPRHGKGRGARVILVSSAFLLTLLVTAMAVRDGYALARSQAQDMGFDSKNLLAMELRLPSSKYPNESSRLVFFQQALARIESLPGVRSAAVVYPLPPGGESVEVGVQTEGRVPDLVPETVISPDYFRTMRIPLVAGRMFTEQDTSSSKPVVIVSKTFARLLFPDEDPVGKQITLVNTPDKFEIIGVVGDVSTVWTEPKKSDNTHSPGIYTSYAQRPAAKMAFVIQSVVDPGILGSVARQEISLLDKDQPVLSVKTMDAHIASLSARERFASLLSRALAAAAAVVFLLGVVDLLIL
ncbi:MAG TPA: ABC transporter permease [Blastocatellia bacterium]|nr:ABC transporter permease [Blastocatellia bacterium]